MGKRILVFFVLMLTTGFAFSQTKQDYEAAINKFQTFYNKKQPEIIYNMFSPRVQSKMTPGKTKEMVTNMHRDLGEIKAWTFIKQDDQFSFYKLDYAKGGRLILVVCLNKENLFQNFRYNEYHPDYDKLR
jgi:uncharacterized protein